MMCRSLINTWRASLLITSLMAISEAGTTCRPICRGLPVVQWFAFLLCCSNQRCAPQTSCTVQSTFQGLHATHNEACHCRLILGHHNLHQGFVLSQSTVLPYRKKAVHAWSDELGTVCVLKRLCWHPP